MPWPPPLLAAADPWLVAALALGGLWLLLSLLLEAGALRAERLSRVPAPPCFRAPLPVAGRSIRIAFLGDLQRGALDVPLALAPALAAKRADLLVSSGDFASHGEAPYYGIALAAFTRARLPLPTRIVPGNHDLWPRRNRDDRIGGAAFERAFGRRHWTARTGPILLAGLDNGAPYLVDEQLPWIEGILEQHAQVPWLCVCHELPFDLSSPERKPIPGMEAFAALLRRRPPCLIVSGHLHTYHDETIHGIRCIVNAHGGDVHGLALTRADFELLHVTLDGEDVHVERKAYKRRHDPRAALDQLAVRFWSDRRKPWGRVLALPVALVLRMIGRHVPIVRHPEERRPPPRDALIARRREGRLP